MKIKNIVIGVLVVGVLVFGFLAFNSNKNVGAYNNQYDGVVASKVITSSSLTTSTPVAITEASTGDFYIDNIVVSTDATGLATGTNFVVGIDSPTYGVSALLTHAVSSLGANATVDLFSATVKQRTVLQDGDKLVAYCTTANCEGAGKVKVDVILKKATQGALITD